MEIHYRLSVLAEQILRYVVVIVPMSLLAVGVAVIVAG